MRGYEKPFHTRSFHCIFVTREDALDFSEALRKEFPRIRFVREDFAAKFRDLDGWARAYEEADRAGRNRPPQIDFIRDPRDEKLDYFPSLADVLERRFLVWVEPPNWRPRWRKRKREGTLILENLPRLNFTFARGGFRLTDRRRTDGLHGDPYQPLNDLELMPEPIDGKEPILLEGLRMTGGWQKGRKDEEHFIRRVWRLFDKVTTNRLVAVDRHAFTPIPPDGSASSAWGARAAPKALDWARRRRHNYLSWQGALFKPEKYFHWYRPEKDDGDVDGGKAGGPTDATRRSARKKRVELA